MGLIHRKTKYQNAEIVNITADQYKPSKPLRSSCCQLIYALKWMARTLLILCRCADWFEYSLLADGIFKVLLVLSIELLQRPRRRNKNCRHWDSPMHSALKVSLLCKQLKFCSVHFVQMCRYILISVVCIFECQQENERIYAHTKLLFRRLFIKNEVQNRWPNPLDRKKYG